MPNTVLVWDISGLSPIDTYIPSDGSSSLCRTTRLICRCLLSRDPSLHLPHLFHQRDTTPASLEQVWRDHRRCRHESSVAVSTYAPQPAQFCLQISASTPLSPSVHLPVVLAHLSTRYLRQAEPAGWGRRRTTVESETC